MLTLKSRRKCNRCLFQVDPSICFGLNPGSTLGGRQEHTPPSPFYTHLHTHRAKDSNQPNVCLDCGRKPGFLAPNPRRYSENMKSPRREIGILQNAGGLVIRLSLGPWGGFFLFEVCTQAQLTQNRGAKSDPRGHVLLCQRQPECFAVSLENPAGVSQANTPP